MQNEVDRFLDAWEAMAANQRHVVKLGEATAAAPPDDKAGPLDAEIAAHPRSHDLASQVWQTGYEMIEALNLRRVVMTDEQHTRFLRLVGSFDQLQAKLNDLAAGATRPPEEGA